MLLLFSTAFLGGVAIAVSPCVLPILPILFSSGAGTKLKPLGIFTGFTLVFTAIFVSLSAIATAIPAAPEIILYLGSALLIILGLILAIPALHLQWELALSKISSGFTSKQEGSHSGGGFVAGFIVGMSLGLVWSPCVGPVMAGVLTLSFSGGSNSVALFSAFFWALGAGIPMLGVAYGGQAFAKHIKKLQKSSARIMQVFGIILILSGLMIATGIDKRITATLLEILPEEFNFAENLGRGEKVDKLIEEHILEE